MRCAQAELNICRLLPCAVDHTAVVLMIGVRADLLGLGCGLDHGLGGLGLGSSLGLGGLHSVYAQS